MLPDGSIFSRFTVWLGSTPSSRTVDSVSFLRKITMSDVNLWHSFRFHKSIDQKFSECFTNFCCDSLNLATACYNVTKTLQKIHSFFTLDVRQLRHVHFQPSPTKYISTAKNPLYNGRGDGGRGLEVYQKMLAIFVSWLKNAIEIY